MDTILTIETRRTAMGLSQADLCRAAGVSERGYRYLLRGAKAPRAAMLAKLAAALKRFKIGFGAEARDLAPHVAFKAVVALAAFELKADALSAVNAVPGRKAAADPIWLQASQCRMVAYAVANGCFGMTTADIARAAGVDKSTVSLGIRTVNDRRDDEPELERVLTRLEGIFG